MHRILAIALLLITAACATTQTIVPTAADADPRAGTIVFYRANTLPGYGQRTDILLDGAVVARSAPGQRFDVRALPGRHVIALPNFMYDGGRGLEVDVRTGETVYVRTGIGLASLGGRFEVELVDAGAASADLKQLQAKR